MAQRTVCLCDGKYIGIETIYTVIDGKQINIPEKLKELRIKSQNNQLFCPCGCGANLILVAGDKNLREQHFRLKECSDDSKCAFEVEGKASINSKIVLKCWLDDKLQDVALESRVPISHVGDVERKYEITFLSREKKIAISYCYNRVNISDEKLGLLQDVCKNINILHIVDIANGGSNGQYPEVLMKLQERQGYCLLLDVKSASYENAKLQSVIYVKDLDGFWQERTITQGLLHDYSFDSKGQILFKNNSVMALKEVVLNSFTSEMQVEQKRREEIKQFHEIERLRKIQLQEQRKRELEEAQKKQKELALEKNRKKEELELRKKEEYLKKEEEFKNLFGSDFSKQDKPIKDADGNRWIQCEVCGKKAKENDFLSYGGLNRVNLGLCKECSARGLVSTGKNLISESTNKGIANTDDSICPICGGLLREKKGPYGKFMGCSNYPRCRYSRKIK